MKRILAGLVVLCMVIGLMPIMSFAKEATIKSTTTAFFTPSNALSAVEGSAESGGSCVLVAWNHSDNWNAANSFTDTDGSVTNQSVTSGTPFGTSRNAVVSFDIPQDFDAESTSKVTLGITVRFVKQIGQAGARLAIYGNSIDGVWTTATPTSSFGVSGSNSGIPNLPLLGLTSTINMAGNNQVDQEVTLSSFALTEYVKKMAAEGKSQVTFRIAVPYGGVWIYNSSSAHPATLKIEEGALTSVNIKTVYVDGGAEVESENDVVTNVVAGSTYAYTGSPATSLEIGGHLYTYSPEKSTLEVVVKEDGTSEIVIWYDKFDDSQVFSGYEIDDEGAWCWFADPRSISYKNEEGTLDFSIIGYIDIHGSIKAMQIDHLTDTVNEVLIRTNIQPDDHNNPTFLVLPDERIIVFYSRHTDEACFWYRVTEKKGDLTTLGEEKCLNTSANTTYPSPFLMENDPDHIYLMWRGINWHPTIAKLSIPDENGNTAFTYGPYQMVQSTAARPYAKYSSNGVDKLYVTYTLGHPDNEANNWVFFNQINIEDMTLEDVNGNTMTTIANGVLNVNASNSNQSHIVVAEGMRDWVWQVAEGSDGYPVIALVKINGGKTSHDYYYAKWNGTKWVITFLANGGGHFHQTGGLEMCYSGGMAIDPDNTNVMYCSVPVEGAFGRVYEIIKYTMSDDGTRIVDTEQITKNSVKNNVRPFILPNSEGKDIRLVWMYGDYYDWIVSADRPLGYCTAVHAEAPLPKKAVVADAKVVESYDEIGGAFVATASTGNVFEVSENGEFTVSADIYLGGDYEGTLLDMGEWELKVETRSTQYGATVTGDRARLVFTNGEEEFVSSNVYGSSDCWTTYGRGTGGNYGVANYDNYVNLTITYDGENVVIYRDGALDVKAAVTGFTLENVVVGGFEGYCENVAVYDRVVNNDEIKALNEVDYTVADPGVEGDVVLKVNYVTTTGGEIKSNTSTLRPGTDYYNFIPEETVIENGVVYTLYDYEFVKEAMTATAVYEKMVNTGANLMLDGSFEDEEGNFSWGTWQSPETSNYFKDTCEDWFYKVNRDTNAAALYRTQSITADDYALGTRWNDGERGLCSMANFIEVKKGKTYYVSYDYKHSIAGTDGGFISTAFVPTKNMALNGSGNNIPKNVTTQWQTNEFVITAPEDGYIYFHFSWLGIPAQNGNGPYWYFDNFEVFELKKEDIKASIVSGDDSQTVVKIENVSAGKIENIKVYAASVDGDTVTEAEVQTVSLDGNDFDTLTFNVGGNVKIFVWDSGMQPIVDKVEN